MSGWVGPPRRPWELERMPDTDHSADAIVRTINHVEQTTDAGQLLSPQELVYKMMRIPSFPDHELKRCLIRQHQLATHLRNGNWINLLQQETRFHLPDEWVIENLPHFIPSQNITVRPKMRSGDKHGGSMFRSGPGMEGGIQQPGFNAADRSRMSGSSFSAGGASSTRDRMFVAEASDAKKRKYSSTNVSTSHHSPRSEQPSTSKGREHEKKPVSNQRKESRFDSIRDKLPRTSQNRKDKFTKVDRHITPNPEARRQDDMKEDKKGKQSECPVPECKIRTQTLARHVRMHHLPPPFRPEVSDRMNHQRMAALKLVAQWLGSTVEMLVDFVFGQVPYQSTPVSHNYIKVFNSLCRHNGWKPPEQFDLRKPSSPCMLVHWRLILTLICMLTEEQRTTFHHLFPESTDSSTTVSEPAKRPEVPVLQPVLIIDTHYHIDRTARAMNLNDRVALLEDILRVYQQPMPCQPVILEGGVAVYSDPDRYPDVYPSGDGGGKFISAFGCHPMKVHQFSVDKTRELWDLLDNNLTAAIGDIGLDWTEPDDTWATQEAVFSEILERCCLRRTLVLHVRDRMGKMAAYYRALELVREACGYRQKIHLHSFAGNPEVVTAWLTYFPNMCFGFTGEVREFSESQLQALRDVPIQNLVLESDSPYMSPHSALEVNTPAYLGDVAQKIADIRGVQLQDLLISCNENARVLYRLPGF